MVAIVSGEMAIADGAGGGAVVGVEFGGFVVVVVIVIVVCGRGIVVVAKRVDKRVDKRVVDAVVDVAVVDSGVVEGAVAVAVAVVVVFVVVVFVFVVVVVEVAVAVVVGRDVDVDDRDVVADEDVAGVGVGVEVAVHGKLATLLVRHGRPESESGKAVQEVVCSRRRCKCNCVFSCERLQDHRRPQDKDKGAGEITGKERK